MPHSYIFSSESVTEGHPDKVCDSVSDAILDACLEQDSHSRVACETFAKDNMIGLAGEISTRAQLDYTSIIRETVQEIGYDSETAEGTDYSYSCNFDAKRLFTLNFLGQQSPEIAQGVDAEGANHKETQEQGAGDQGIMFGYAIDETSALMPAPLHYSHILSKELTRLRKSGELPWLRPDAKTQVSVEYVDQVPQRISAVVVSTMHAREISTPELRGIILDKLIQKALPAELLTNDTEYHINPTGVFVIGGPEGDAGLTGRKIIVDTYGGAGRHGGGAFSGKDPSKVDRSAAYMCRWVAKNIVAAGYAKRCELQISYAIGYPDPISIHIDTFGTNTVDESQIISAVREIFSFKPSDIIRELDLRRPIYRATTNYGHFGREDANLPWEELNRVDALRHFLG